MDPSEGPESAKPLPGVATYELRVHTENIVTGKG